jgi:Fe-S cluster assembly ATP-binding protein
MISISNLSVCLQDKTIINNLSLTLHDGSIHAIMGPNGSGKSTLALALMSHPSYTVKGSILHNNQEVIQLTADKRARAGFFLAFQQPIEIPGVSLFAVLKEAYTARIGKAIDIKEFQKRIYELMDLLQMDHAMLSRSIHEGFSGGEKKRIELLQLFEIDSGLDVDAIKIVAEGIKHVRVQNPAIVILLITHYPRMLQYLPVDAVHILINGSIRESGPQTLSQQIELKGYDAFGC